MGSRGQRYQTFALKDDWAPVLTSLEESLSIKYVEDGPMPIEGRQEYSTFRDLPSFGNAMRGDAVQETRYLVLKKDTPLVYEVFRLKTGEKRFDLGHDNNPQSVVFAPGGLFKEQKAVIQGEISKLATLDSTEEIFKSFGKLIKKHFTHIKGWWVGPGALSLKAQGYRLTASVNNPPECSDLQ